jgi:hypothetical protein
VKSAPPLEPQYALTLGASPRPRITRATSTWSSYHQDRTIQGALLPTNNLQPSDYLAVYSLSGRRTDLLCYFTSIVNAMFEWPAPQKTEHGIRYVPVFIGVKVTSTVLPGAMTVWLMPRALD